ncbi:hypothetical protein GQ457_07G044470 [Hibiscus cannabinus]
MKLKPNSLILLASAIALPLFPLPIFPLSSLVLLLSINQILVSVQICVCFSHILVLTDVFQVWPIFQTQTGSNDPDLKQEMEKQFMDLLTEELKLEEAVAEEHTRHMNITCSEAKRVGFSEPKGSQNMHHCHGNL